MQGLEDSKVMKAPMTSLSTFNSPDMLDREEDDDDDDDEEEEEEEAAEKGKKARMFVYLLVFLGNPTCSTSACAITQPSPHSLMSCVCSGLPRPELFPSHRCTSRSG